MTKLQANAPGLHYILYYGKAEDWDKEKDDKDKDKDKKKEKGKKEVVIKDPTIERFKVPNAGYYIKWKFQILARNDVGPGPISDIGVSYSGQDAPKGKPTNVKIGKIFARKIELSWDRVSIDGKRGSIDGYKV